MKITNLNTKLIKNNQLLYFKKALLTIFKYHKYKKTILFIGNFSKEKNLITNNRFKNNHIFLSESNWVYGMITNKKSFIKSLRKKNDKRLKDYELQKFLIKRKKPDLIVILNSIHRNDILKESSKLKIPTIALTDNFYNDAILYPIKMKEEMKSCDIIFYLLNSILKKK